MLGTRQSRGADEQADLAAEPPSYIFLTLPTPNEGLRYDLSAFRAGTAAVGTALGDSREVHTVVVRSTVPPKTTEELVRPLLEQNSGKTVGHDICLASNPEFLRAASAREDFRWPWMTVIASENKRTQERLVELFGRPEDWGRYLHALHWTTLNVNVPAFSRSTLVDLHVPCTYDLEVTGAKYLNALGDGEVPLEFLFSGTVFYAAAGGLLQVARIDWESEAAYKLPVGVWREMMDRHFPDSSWLRLRRDQFDRLATYRAANALLTWEATVESLLDAAARAEEHSP